MRLSGKKVLVTGSDGFIGSHLVEHLIRQGCKVRAFVFYNAFNSLGWLDALRKDQLKRIEIISGDIRDYANVRRAVKGVDILFHLAALIGIPYSYYSPDSYIDTNIKGTFNILQAGRDFKVEKIIVTSTSEVYGTAKYVPIDEGHPLAAQSPYAATKVGADKMAESFYLSFNLPVTLARPFNTYGPRQSARAICTTIITQALSKEKKISLGNLAPTRDFIYVGDVCEGFIEIAKSERTVGRTVNICSGQEISIGDLASLILRISGKSKKIITDHQRIRPKNSEVQRLLGCNKTIYSITDWKPSYTLEKGLRETIRWFSRLKNLAHFKSEIYNI